MNARRHSPAVYRRRRLVVLLIALLVIAGVAWLVIAQPWRGAGEAVAGGDEQPSPTPAESSETSPSPTPSDDGSPKACDPNAVQVEPLTDKGEYAADAQPKMSIRLTNIGEVDCTFNVGTTKQVFVVRSGNDVWWRSTDCQAEPADMVVTLEAGQEVTSAEPVVWDRTRSSVDSCEDENRPVAPGGGSSYHLSVSIGGIESGSSRQFILR